MLLRGPVERPEQRAPLDPRTAPSRIDPDTSHRREVDHEPAVGYGESEDAVPAAAHADLEVVLAGEPHRRCHVVAARAANDYLWAPVDHGVPDRACLVVSGVSWQQ
jgi:hypothetical protein